MNPARLILVRHGQTTWSAEGRHTGRTDVPLTALGRRQATELGAMLQETEPSMVLSSPLTRARQTMDLAGYGGAGVLVEDLMEWDYGVYEGRRTSDIRTEIPNWSIWTHPIVGGETAERVGRRADAVIAQVLDVAGSVLLFAHAHLLRILAARWLGLDAGAGRLLALDTASISVLGWEHESRVIRLWNRPCALPSTDPAP